MSLKRSPVVVIGAPRSGTKLLRDLLCTFPGYGTWPCDEINYIWRYSNARLPHDELRPQDATERTTRYIRQAFERLERKQRLSRIVEKTCANSLRVEFVEEVLDEPVYLQIHRDGRDAAVSARERWAGSAGLKYSLRKMRYIPTVELPYYLGLQFKNRLHRLVSDESRVAFWGPRFRGISEAMASSDLIEVCGLQWKRCVERSREAFRAISDDRLMTVRYEDLVRSPVETILDIANFLDEELARPEARDRVEHVEDSSVGRWQQSLDHREAEALTEVIRNPLENLGYL